MRVAVRQAIQLEFIKQLRMKDFSFENNQKEPHGIISEVTANVNKQEIWTREVQRVEAVCQLLDRQSQKQRVSTDTSHTRLLKIIAKQAKVS